MQCEKKYSFIITNDIINMIYMDKYLQNNIVDNGNNKTINKLLIFGCKII